MNIPSAPPWAKWLGLFCLTLGIVLLPFFLVGDVVEVWVNRLLHTGSAYPQLTSLFLSLLLMSDIVLPLPSSLVSIAAGALQGWLIGFWVSLIGMSVACVLGYGLGRYLGAPALRRFISEGERTRLRIAVQRYGGSTIILFRAVPVLAEASAIFAGISRMHWKRFLGLSILANAGISAVYAGIGAYALELNSFLLAFAGALAVPILGTWLSHRFMPKHQCPPSNRKSVISKQVASKR